MEEQEYAKLINSAKHSEESLMQVIIKMKPLINAYAKKMFFMDLSDAEQEMTLAVIEAVRGVPICEKDGQCLSYIKNAVYFRFSYLCKQNRKIEILEAPYENAEDAGEICIEKYEEVEILYDLEKLPISKKQKDILTYIYLGYSDREIAEKMSLSRQYVNRIKKEILIATHTKML